MNTTHRTPAASLLTMLLILVLSPTTACNDGHCTTTDDCRPEEVCVYKTCRKVCDRHSQCTGEERCIGGACLPFEEVVDASTTDDGRNDRLLADQQTDRPQTDRQQTDLPATDATDAGDRTPADRESTDLPRSDGHRTDHPLDHTVSPDTAVTCDTSCGGDCGLNHRCDDDPTSPTCGTCLVDCDPTCADISCSEGRVCDTSLSSTSCGQCVCGDGGWCSGSLDCCTPLAPAAIGATALHEGFEDVPVGTTPPEWGLWVEQPCGQELGTLKVEQGGAATGQRSLHFGMVNSSCTIWGTWTLPTPRPVKAMGIKLKMTGPGSSLLINLRDSLGQSYNYRIPYPNHEHRAPDSWVEQTFRLDRLVRNWGDLGHSCEPPGDIVYIRFVLSPGVRQTATIAAELDDLVLYDRVPEPVVDPFALSYPAPDPGTLREVSGSNIKFPRGVPGSIEPAHLEQLDLAVDAGLGWIRGSVTWNSVEQITDPGGPGEQSHFDLAAHDTLLAELEARDLRWLAMLGYGHEHYFTRYEQATNPDAPASFTDKWGPTADGYVEAFVNYAATVADHFRGHDIIYELWNEPNGNGFWRSRDGATLTERAADYGRMAAEAIAAMKAVDPDVKVVIGSTSWMHFDYIRALLDSGADLDAIHGVSVHPYRNNINGTNPYFVNPETLASDLGAMRWLVDAEMGRSGVPVIDSEWGYQSAKWVNWEEVYTDLCRTGTLDEPQAFWRHAVYTARMLLHNHLLGLPLSIIYEHRTSDQGDPTRCDTPGYGDLYGPDSAGCPERHGLLSTTLEPHPSFLALQAMQQLLGGQIIQGAIDPGHAELFGILYADETTETAVLWNSHELKPQRIALRWYAGMEAFDLLGEAIPLEPAPACGVVEVELDEAAGPIFIRKPLATTATCD